MDRANMDGPSRRAAAGRAQEYRCQAEAYRRLAATEPLAQKRHLLELSAARYDEVADGEERVAFGTRREEARAWPRSGGAEPGV